MASGQGSLLRARATVCGARRRRREQGEQAQLQRVRVLYLVDKHVRVSTLQRAAHLTSAHLIYCAGWHMHTCPTQGKPCGKGRYQARCVSLKLSLVFPHEGAV